jgi:probable rRNA maturation factor
MVQTILREYFKCEVFELGVYIVHAPEITHLNETYLQHAGPTDVITFDYCEPTRLAGDIFVCVEEAKSHARRFRTTWRCELVRYIIHGLLHLRGYDDKRAAARRKMKAEEARVLGCTIGEFDVDRL